MIDLARIIQTLGGRIRGRHGICFCPAHSNTRTPALSVALGDNGRLLLHCFAGCSFNAIMAALRRLGLVDDQNNHHQPTPGELARLKSVETAKTERRILQAQKVWAEALPIGETLAETYLRTRGISARLPESLRFHPEAWHGPTARHHPAMVGLIEGGAGFAIHRTFIKPDGSGKADVAAGTAKMMLGPTRGGHVKISGGHPVLVVTEGLETALSLASGLLRQPTSIWAALSTSGIRALALPPTPGRMIIAADGDPAGIEAAKSLGDRAYCQGWKVSLWPAPDGQDWNDVLQERGTA